MRTWAYSCEMANLVTGSCAFFDIAALASIVFIKRLKIGRLIASSVLIPRPEAAHPYGEEDRITVARFLEMA